MNAEELQALQAVRDYGDTRRFFAEVRHAVGRLDAVRHELADVADMLPTSGSGHGSGISKPTEARALWLVCEAPAMAQRLEAERERLEAVIGCGLVLCQMVRDGLGDVYAEVMEAHYVDCMPWADVAESVGYSVPHAKRLGGVACDWIDYKTEGR